MPFGIVYPMRGISIDTSYKLCTQNIKWICKNAIYSVATFYSSPDALLSHLLCEWLSVAGSTMAELQLKICRGWFVLISVMVIISSTYAIQTLWVCDCNRDSLWIVEKSPIKCIWTPLIASESKSVRFRTLFTDEKKMLEFKNKREKTPKQFHACELIQKGKKIQIKLVYLCVDASQMVLTGRTFQKGLITVAMYGKQACSCPLFENKSVRFGKRRREEEERKKTRTNKHWIFGFLTLNRCPLNFRALLNLRVVYKSVGLNLKAFNHSKTAAFFLSLNTPNTFRQNKLSP